MHGIGSKRVSSMTPTANASWRLLERPAFADLGIPLLEAR